MQTQTLQASLRGGTGKGSARKLRSEGLIPAVAYGAAGETASLALDPQQLRELRRSSLGWNMPVSIDVDGGDNIPLALLRDVQKHPISRALLHADFLRVDPADEVVIRVQLRLEGKAPGAELGGLINQPNRELLVSCKPADIPATIVIDISGLEINDRLLLSEVPMPKGCRAVFKHDGTAVSCMGRRGGGLDDEDGEESEELAEGEEAEEAAEE
ncbi:MAG: 50S ribosomal protein L25 [Proteobacteria bacterium]|nr:50S ribosomal protein L25 [Pseudomonadota bacterium]